jgi:hypothetical protein
MMLKRPGREQHMTDTFDRITLHRTDHVPYLSARRSIRARCLSKTGTATRSCASIDNVTDQQLAALYIEIGRKLGIASSVTMEHLRKLHAHLDGLVRST